MPQKTTRAFSCLMAFLVLSMSGEVPGHKKKPAKLSIYGTVVAFDFMSTVLTLYEPFDSPIKSPVMIVRVEKVIHGQENSRYIKLLYRYWPDKDPYPSEEVRDGKKQIRFDVVRDERCDGRLRDVLYVKAETVEGNKLPDQINLIRTSGGQTEEIAP